jgi:hypothetical protein
VSTGGFIVHVSALVWAITLVTMIVIFAVDLLIIGRRPHEPSMRESAIWVGVYVALAMVFGAVLLAAYGPRYGGEFFAGWLTEYSLSVDNLFVFVIIMARFAVPRMLQQKVLLIGVMLALVMRGALIAAGAAVVNRFVWVFYLFRSIPDLHRDRSHPAASRRCGRVQGKRADPVGAADSADVRPVRWRPADHVRRARRSRR